MASAGTAGGAETLALPSSQARSQGELINVTPATHSTARLWNEALLEAIRRDVPRVTVHARNLFHTSAAKYDAWAAYSDQDLSYFHDESAAVPTGFTLAEARNKAISFAAYRMLSHRFQLSTGHTDSQADFDSLMTTLGYDTGLEGTTGDRPHAVGNRIAATIIAHALDDGSNEGGNYVGPGGYNPVNLPMLVVSPGTGGLSDINAWQPLIPPAATGVQGYLTSHWGNIEPFALERPDNDGFYIDPGPPPLLGGAGDAQLKTEIVELIRKSSLLDPDASELINISPAALGNNPAGSDSGPGHAVNPVTGQPYPDQYVREGDWGRVLAEFWEDGPDSSTPPGHWTEIANVVSDALDDKRIAGHGPVVDDLEWDIKLYLALHGALHDSAISAWEAKIGYNSSRPITLIRGMAEYGQSTDSDLPGYHPDGLPLVDNLIELITPSSTQPGQRHAHLADHVDEIAIRAWLGYPQNPETENAGSGWIRGVEWLPYQAEDFITPPFPGYVSGHSTFSRAGAEVLAAMTGDAFFPGGLAEYHVGEGGNYSLHFEYGPSEPLTLQWATYFDAADEAGRSRVYGGIHPPFDDFPGRIMGQQIGQTAFIEAMSRFAPVGEAPSPGAPIAVPALSPWALLLLGLGMIGMARRQG